VLQRLLDGLTYDGIAADLGLSVASVKTYRARAFERLGIHFRSQLFALLRHDG
jgi:DNA-binding NarL/FixJ family response regulator